ncbi:GNAT family N-acetyltransferase [Parasalinivibrio latis]|uniref:GNAT family N-acetyltransferase n=1 Tax=Parasalinivibrio latis TaxID=2952610 RepID=UPI0030E35481
MSFDKVTLEGTAVKLEPMTPAHKDALIDIVKDGELWKLFFTSVPRPEEVATYIRDAISRYESGDGLPFVTIDKRSNRVVGSTRFANADLANKGVEIGYTFIGKSFQRSPVNTEAKLLMLSHAFETLNLNRVEFRTDFLNHNSRNAILRLGAREEGVLRCHKVMPDGRIRDTVVFSITKHDWCGVKQGLVHRLRTG